MNKIYFNRFLRMFNLLEAERNLSQLPNWAFGVALAKFHLAKAAKDETEVLIYSLNYGFFCSFIYGLIFIHRELHCIRHQTRLCRKR